MAVTAAGVFRRTPGERADQRLAWNRADQPFFAAGACHILAWVCRDTYPDRPIGLAGLRFAGQRQVVHVYATWADWAFDHAGWNPEAYRTRLTARGARGRAGPAVVGAGPASRRF
ncbi:hypothetical protein ACGF5H_29575 [Micromonospora chalcea]